jgi:hypothetical protein
MRKYENPSNQKFKKSACTDFRKPLLYPFELRGQLRLNAFAMQDNFLRLIVISKRAGADQRRKTWR